jgi:hypothetical protein
LTVKLRKDQLDTLTKSRTCSGTRFALQVISGDDELKDKRDSLDSDNKDPLKLAAYMVKVTTWKDAKNNSNGGRVKSGRHTAATLAM